MGWSISYDYDLMFLSDNFILKHYFTENIVAYSFSNICSYTDVFYIETCKQINK